MNIRPVQLSAPIGDGYAADEAKSLDNRTLTRLIWTLEGFSVLASGAAQIGPFCSPRTSCTAEIAGVLPLSSASLG